MQPIVIKFVITLRFLNLITEKINDTPEIEPIKMKKIGQINRKNVLAASWDNDTLTDGAITPDWKIIMVARTTESIRGRGFMILKNYIDSSNTHQGVLGKRLRRANTKDDMTDSLIKN